MWWVNFNQGCCVNTWLPVVCIRRGFYYFSQRVPRSNRIHVIWGWDVSLRAAVGVSWNCFNFFKREKW